MAYVSVVPLYVHSVFFPLHFFYYAWASFLFVRLIDYFNSQLVLLYKFHVSLLKLLIICEGSRFALTKARFTVDFTRSALIHGCTLINGCALKRGWLCLLQLKRICLFLALQLVSIDDALRLELLYTLAC